MASKKPRKNLSDIPVNTIHYLFKLLKFTYFLVVFILFSLAVLGAILIVNSGEPESETYKTTLMLFEFVKTYLIPLLVTAILFHYSTDLFIGIMKANNK